MGICDVILPWMTKSSALEDLGELRSRMSLLLDVTEGSPDRGRGVGQTEIEK